MKQNYTKNSLFAINALFSTINGFKKVFGVNKAVLVFLLLFVQAVVVAQTNTYTGSLTTGGELRWSTAANWSLGIVPSSLHDVVIPSGKTVTLDVTPVNANSITISGTLDLNKFAEMVINSSLIVVTSPSGNINFDHSTIRLLSSVALYLQNGSASLNGSCNNNDDIYVGAVQYAVCKGANGDLYLFDDIEAAGGINVVTAGQIGSAQTICSGTSPAILTGTSAVSGSGTISYEWQTNASGSYVTINGENSASYQPPSLSATTSYRRITKSVDKGKVFYSEYSAAVIITVTAAQSATIAYSGNPYCKSLTSGQSVIQTGRSGGTYSSTTGLTINSSTGAITPSSSTAGNYIVTYTFGSGGCAGLTTTTSITITAVPNAGTLSGAQGICVGGNITFSSSTSGGTWSSDTTGIATVNSSTGVITGVSAGTTTITYTVAGTGGCSAATATRTVTVTAAPNAGNLSGMQGICVGGNTTFSSSTSGGTWSSGTTGIATVNTSTGVITGVSAGTVTITYTVAGTGGCSAATAARTVTVSAPIAQTVSGTNTVCIGSTTTFSSTTSGGTWTSATPAVATVNASTGVVTGVSTGTSVINYSVTTAGGCVNTASQTVTVSAPIAQTVSGTNTVCIGSTTTFSTTTSGGTWTSATPAIATVNSSTGVVTGVSAGTSVINYSITTAGGCINTASRTVTVSAPAIAGTLSGSQEICVGGTTTYTSNGTWGGSWTSSATTVATVNASTGVVTGAGPGIATITYAVVGIGGCSDATVTRDIIVNPIPTAPTVDKTTQPDCKVPTGSVVLSGLPSSGSINQAGANNKIYTITGSPITITGLIKGTYDFKVTNDLGCSSGGVTVEINDATIVTNTWTGTSWDNGATTTDQRIVFADHYNEDADVNGCSCLVTGNKNVTIKKGKTMKIVYDVDVQPNGSLTFDNDASLVQIDDNAVNSGNIIYKRTTAAIYDTDYVYWSSPVIGAKLSAIQSGTLYYSFYAAGNSWTRAYATTTMVNGIGYIVRGAGTGLPNGPYIARTASFTGVPFNGGKSVSIAASKSNLIGNPYPSAIDGDAFLTANKDVLEGTLYFWTHASTIKLASEIQEGTAGSGKFAYTSNDYTTFNYTGGTSGAPGIIAAGQGFFAIGGSGGMASFTNRMRLGSGTDQAILDNSQFLKQVSISKTEKTTTTNKVEKNRIWLNFSNTQGAFKQILIGYLEGATNGYDKGYDGVSFNGNSFINFYSINNTSLLTIQGRALPIQETDIVPLGYSSTIVGDFSISIDKTDGALSTMAVFLEDKLTNTTHNLKKGAYTFTTEKGTFNERFVLSYTNKTLATDDFEVLENGVVITSKNKEININSSTNYIGKVFVYDVAGKQIFVKSKIDKNEFTISNIGNTDHVLIVKVSLQDNTIVTKKVIF